MNLLQFPMISIARRNSGAVVVAVVGQLGVGNREALKQHFIDELANGARAFVLDLTCAGYIDASGLGVLVSIEKRVRDAGGEIVLAGLNEDLTELFEITKLDTAFPIADNLKAGVAYIERERVPA